MMRRAVILAVGVAALGGALYASAQEAPPPPAAATGLRPVSAFASISNREQRSIALFEEAGKVIQHPRCVNCHPRTDRPLQTAAGLLHQPLVVRGPDGHGAPGMECATCHHDANFDAARVPGNPHWALAPSEMAWEGKSLGEICGQIKDRKRNGNKDLDAIAHHMGEDSLVGWAWEPGIGRTPAPGTQAEFGALIRAWVDAGAICPPAKAAR